MLAQPTAPESLNRARFRTLVVALLLVAGAAIGAGWIVAQLPAVVPLEWWVMVGAGGVCLAILPWLLWAENQDDRRALAVIALLVVGIAALLLLQRMAVTLYGPMIADPAQTLFRPHYAFVPFLYLGTVALLRARVALRMCWAFWGLQLLLVLPALALQVGWDLSREGLSMVLLWLLLCNPLFITLLQALPHYEEALDVQTSELALLRGRVTVSEQLRESEQRFNLVVQGLNVGVWDFWLDGGGRHWWSPRLYELLGYTVDELPANRDSQKRMIHPDDWQRIWDEGGKQLKKSDILDVEYRVKTKSRGYRWFNSHGKAQRDAAGTVIRLTGAITDIHDQREAEVALEQAKSELTRLAYRDNTTGLNNRRAFDEKFYNEWQRAVRYGRPLSLMLLDLDHFKAYNDTKGHGAGDECLRRISECTQVTVRKGTDFVARVGGEEFAVILPETAADGAVEVAKKVHTAIRAMAIAHPGSPMEIVTVSIGVASLQPPSTDTAPLLYEQADRALYHIKRCGRDDVMHIRTLETAPGAAA